MSAIETEPPKIAADVAEEEFERWLDAMDLNRKMDPSTLNDEDKRSLADTKAVLIGAMMKGSLVVDPAGQFVFTPVLSDNKTPITFYEPTGASLQAADTAKIGHAVTKLFKFLGDCTHTSAERFSKLKNRDVAVCQAIGLVFLAT